MSCKGKTAPKAVIGPLCGMTIGFGSKSLANSGLSVMIITFAPRALTSSAAVLMWWTWLSSRIIIVIGVAPNLPKRFWSVSSQPRSRPNHPNKPRSTRSIPTGTGGTRLEIFRALHLLATKSGFEIFSLPPFTLSFSRHSKPKIEVHPSASSLSLSFHQASSTC